MRIDCHTHLTDPPENIIKMLDALHIDKAVVCSSGLANGEKIHTITDAKNTMALVEKAQNNTVLTKSLHEINTEILEAVKQNPQMLIGFGKVDIFKPDCLKDAEEVFNMGLSGIGEIIGVHGNVSLLENLVRFSEEHDGYPLFVHCDYPVDAKDLTELAELAKKYPKSVIIIGHFGGDFWLMALDIAKAYDNVYLDISEIVNQVPLKIAAAEIPDKILYGTDAPWDLAESVIVRVSGLDVSDSVKEQIMGGNLARILKL